MQRLGMLMKLMLVLFCVGILKANQQSLDKSTHVKQTLGKETRKRWYIKDSFAAQVGKDILNIHKNIFHWDTFKTIIGAFPLYVFTRMFDTNLQKKFYHGQCKHGCHTDRHQAPRWCKKLSQFGLGVPIVILGGAAFVGKTEELRVTGRVFLTGMPFVVFGKDVFKKIRFHGAERPWCGRFSSKERAFGGFPSGHMAEITYMTVLYGLRYGPRAAGPLAVFGSFLGATFINCNRHYVSQIVAGAGIGTIFAMAANKVIDARLNTSKNYHMNLSLEADERGTPAVKVGCRF